MIEPTDNYSARVDQIAQDTVYLLKIPALGVSYSTAPIPGLATNLYLAERPQGVQSQTHPLTGASDIGGLSLRLLDKDRAVTTLRQASGFVGQEAEVMQGYSGLPAADFLSILTGKVTGFKVAEPGLSYALDISDRFDQADFPVFRETDIAAEPWTGGDKSFDGGALVLSDTDEDDIYDTVTLLGNPVDLVLKMLLSGGGNGMVEYPVGVFTDFDRWPVWAGAGLTIDEVDGPWCLAERAKLLTVDMRFTLSGQESAKAFVEEEVCKALGGYSILSGTGKIRIHFPASPNSTADLALLDDTVLIQKPAPADSSEFHITHIVFELGDAGDGPTIILRRASPEFLAGLYPGEERKHEIKSRGLQPDLGGVGIAYAVMDALFSRYSAPPPRVRLQTFFEKHLIEAGDVVRVSSAFWTDWDGRGVQTERLLEVVSSKPNVDKVDLECIDLTGPLSAGTRAIIAPNFAPAVVWTTASEAQKAYAFIANAATGTFSDGEPSYIWG